ncbi:MAG TPA: hypothetical protein VLH79_01390 [Chthonomonadales bacterium]|nr:hypothetical protein [Chthonomonadales bacterium]
MSGAETADGAPAGPAAPARSRRWALGIAALAVALTTLPYLFAWSLQGARPALGWYGWLGYNLDDSCVYLAWMRQTADGSLFQRNLFTTEPQVGRQFNLFFVLLGWLCGITGLPPLAIYHIARLVLGVALLRAVWWLLEQTLAQDRARRLAYLCVAFSAGLGWVPGLWRQSGINSPIDVWQPEAITFLCLYLSPLFLVSLLLMVGVLGWLWVAERTRQWRAVLWAGLCGLALGNVHTYEVITLVAVWGAYLVARSVVERRLRLDAWLRGIAVGAMTAVSAAHMYWVYRTETVFALRVAVETTWPQEPALRYGLPLLGYGLLVPLAIAGAWLLLRRARSTGASLAPAYAGLFLVAWAVMNPLVSYLPVTFQRKLLMGTHLPVSILAGVALAVALSRLRGRAWALAAAACVLALAPTNARFLIRDAQNALQNRAQTNIQRPFMYSGEVAALEWLRANTPRGDAIQPLPWIGVAPGGAVGFVDSTMASFAPGLTGRPVHAGHWGETPSFGPTMNLWVRFLRPDTPDEWRRDLLRQSGVRWLVFSQKRPEAAAIAGGLVDARTLAALPYLRRVDEASNEDADVYAVTLEPHGQ